MDFDQPEVSYFNHRSGHATIPEIKWEEPLEVEIQHFVDCIIKKIPCLTGVEHAKKVVRILEAGSKRKILSET
jgi:predicted dehydrogenase